ncbi:hypothetical protein D3C87_280090 [compost metagenome]
MSKVSTLLREKAEELRLSSPEEVAIEHLKQAGFSDEDARYQVAQHIMEKEAASALTMRGVDAEEAVKMVKAAGINLRELTNFTAEKEENPAVELLQKAAEYVETLEAQVETLQSSIEKQAGEIEVLKTPTPELPEQITKIASTGAFTNEDLEQLRRMTPETLTKVASAIEEPWGMGSGVGYARPKTDPLLDWLVG